MKRYSALLGGFLLMTCLGGIYAWSAFVPELQAAFGYKPWHTQTVFAVAIAVFTFGMLITGRLHDRYGPRPMALIAALALGGGYFLSGVFGGSFIGICICYGGLCGAAAAFGYVCPIATGIKWFPSRPGAIGGLMVAGYGGGAILLEVMVKAMLKAGTPVLGVFRTVGLLYGALCVLAALLLFLPDHAHSAPKRVFDRRKLWKDARFYPLLVGMFCGTFPGLMFIGDIRPMGLRLNMMDGIAAAGIITLAIGNGAGRITWGLFQDRFGRRASSLRVLAISALTPLLFFMVLDHATAFLIVTALLGFAYGGSMGIYPAQVSKIYGNDVLGTIYPTVLVVHGIAALTAAPISGKLIELTGSDTAGLLLAAGVAGAGLLLFALLDHRSRQLPEPGPKHSE